jgi:hypothetical protein
MPSRCTAPVLDPWQPKRLVLFVLGIQVDDGSCVLFASM